jgi:D-aminoacyl-tRNA deacylase
MKAIIISKPDIASSNIFDNLLQIRDWNEKDEFQGNPVFYHGDFFIATINDEHIYHDNVDNEISQALGENPEVIIYASRHRSESGKRSLTVHPIGNYGKAEFGGKERTLVPSSPHLMTEAMRILRKKAADLDFSVSFEATHHGPYLETPTFFIEIGSDESAWRNTEAARAIAETVVGIETKGYPVGIGVGGGHYSPRMTDVAKDRKISFGHIVPTYAIPNLDSEMAKKVVQATSGIEKVYFHRKQLKGRQYSELKELFSELGLNSVRTSDLDLLNP